MLSPSTPPRDGGVKIVFDVPEGAVEHVMTRVAGGGFAVRSYYPDGRPRRGGPAMGFVRLGAERASQDFTAAEQVGIVEEFDALAAQAGFTCTRIGTDLWTAG